LPNWSLETLIAIKKATREDIRILSKKLLSLLEDKNSQIYKDNVAKFGIPKITLKSLCRRNIIEGICHWKSNFLHGA
jgi:hypothetical protein